MVELRIGDETLALSWDEWESRVRSGRVPPTALVRFEPATGDQWVRASELELYQSMRNDSAIAWRGQFSDSPPILTALLVGVQIKLWWMAFWTPEASEILVRDLTLYVPPIFEDGQVWRVITMGFAQKATDHLAMNMLWLAYCGWNIERALGRRNLLTIYLGSVVFGAVLSMFGEPATPSLGASGGVFGLVGASIVFGFVRPNLLPERGRRLFGWALVPYLVVMFASGLASEGTDNWSHLGGLLAGAALGLVLDPPPLQRRPRWNALWYGAVGGGTAVLLAVFGLLGPRIHPLDDSESVRQSARSRTVVPPPVGQRSLNWLVPVAWRPGRNAAGDAAFESPAGPRSWGLIEREGNAPVQSGELRDEWVAKLLGTWPDAQVEPVDDATLAGAPALGARVTLPAATGGPRRLEYRVTTRGLSSLQATWEVEVAKEWWLMPLQRRLFAAPRWDEPSRLVSARINYEHMPQSAKVQDQWATELGRVGRLEEAVALRTALVEKNPQVAAYWSGLLDLIAWYPDALPDRDAALQAALDAHPGGSMRAAVAETLDAVGETSVSAGLLDLAWVDTPGDRSVKRARKKRGQSIAMDGTLPWGLVNDPATGEPRNPADIEAIESLPLDLDGARRRGIQLDAERQRVIDAALAALAARDDAALQDRLAWFRQGSTSLDEDERERLIEDVQRAAERDRPAAWIPSEVVDALRKAYAGP